MYDGPIIDAHHHLWEIRNYPWIGETGKERLARQTAQADLLRFLRALPDSLEDPDYEGYNPYSERVGSKLSYAECLAFLAARIGAGPAGRALFLLGQV